MEGHVRRARVVLIVGDHEYEMVLPVVRMNVGQATAMVAADSSKPTAAGTSSPRSLYQAVRAHIESLPPRTTFMSREVADLFGADRSEVAGVLSTLARRGHPPILERLGRGFFRVTGKPPSTSTVEGKTLTPKDVRGVRGYVKEMITFLRGLPPGTEITGDLWKDLGDRHRALTTLNRLSRKRRSLVRRIKHGVYVVPSKVTRQHSDDHSAKMPGPTLPVEDALAALEVIREVYGGSGKGVHSLVDLREDLASLVGEKHVEAALDMYEQSGAIRCLKSADAFFFPVAKKGE